MIEESRRRLRQKQRQRSCIQNTRIIHKIQFMHTHTYIHTYIYTYIHTLIDAKAAWPGVSRNTTLLPAIWTTKALRRWVMPPASEAATFAYRIDMV